MIYIIRGNPINDACITPASININDNYITMSIIRDKNPSDGASIIREENMETIKTRRVTKSEKKGLAWRNR